LSEDEPKDNKWFYSINSRIRCGTSL
jgi:hypothetical protein